MALTTKRDEKPANPFYELLSEGNSWVADTHMARTLNSEIGPEEVYRHCVETRLYVIVHPLTGAWSARMYLKVPVPSCSLEYKYKLLESGIGLKSFEKFLCIVAEWHITVSLGV